MAAASSEVEAVELAARESYGRLLAWLASRCGSLTTAEDALGDALATAVRRWPEIGVPDNPEAWLLTVARRRLIDDGRRRSSRDRATPGLESEARRLQQEALERAEFPLEPGLPDRRLELLFLCAHPDIPAAMRTPLMLQTVLGLTAQQIGSAMLVAPATVGQRLVRVKRRITELGLPFELPPASALPERLGHVLDAVYAAYAVGWESPDLGGGATGLSGEAIWLAGLLVQLLPAEAEAKGLYALLCLCESRRPARRNAAGTFVPLEDQDPARWDAELIRSGELALWHATDQYQGGRYQLEAAIQSLHLDRARTGRTDWAAVCGAYEVLVDRYPSLGAAIGYAAALGRVGQADKGLAVLDQLDADRVIRHQPQWAVRAWLLAEAGQPADADEAYARAIGLTTDPAVRDWLSTRRAAIA